VAIWLGWVSMKKLDGLLAQAGSTGDWPAPSVSICTVKIVMPLALIRPAIFGVQAVREKNDDVLVLRIRILGWRVQRRLLQEGEPAPEQADRLIGGAASGTSD
jgi:hypothetical protein